MSLAITCDGVAYACAEGESVLDCLTAHGVAIPSSCRAGACQSCMMRATKGHVPAKSQAGLKPTLAAQNYFLACICKPEEDLEVALAGDVTRKIAAVVTDMTPLNVEIARVSLRPETAFEYHAGQFIRFYKDGDTSRCYSLASVPELDAPNLHLHVRKIPNGIVSPWIVEDLHAGDTISISEPIGSCFYVPGRPDQGLLLTGTGSGLAPLYGIVRDALHQGHRGPIHLYHGSIDLAGLYLIEALRALERAHPNFHYVPCLSGAHVPAGFNAGMVLDVVLDKHKDLSDWRVFLCGNPAMVESAKRETFLAGASMSEIYADPFLPAAVPPVRAAA